MKGLRSLERHASRRAARSPLGTLVAALCLAAGCAEPAGGPSRPCGILITLDTTNHDALGAFGAPRGVTPRLDRLAASSVAYERARSVAPLTTPAHASMLTGLWPPRHTVRDNAWRPLPAAAVTLAERARDAGYQTAAFLSAVVLAAPYGLDQGFERYDTPGEQAAVATAHLAERPAAETTRLALEWLAGRDRTRPFFLWVHYFEPHAPYRPEPRFLQQAGGNAYLGEVAQMDAALGTLVDALEAEGVLEDALLMVVGDHGEALGRHGEPTHSVLCYDDTLRVPLLVRHPRGRRGGERSRANVSVADVYPSFVEGLGLGAAGDVDGLSLVGAEPPAERRVYFESYAGYLNYGWSPLAGWTDGRSKYLHGTSPELYRLDEDPLEATNRFAPGEGPACRAALARLVAGEPLAPQAGGVGRELVESARALGYAAAAEPSAELPDPLAATGLPDARTRMGELARFYEATNLRNQGRMAEALAAMDALVRESPENVYARNVLASFLLEERRPREAAEVLLALPPERRDRLNVQDCLGHAFEELGELERAAGHFERARALKPGDAHQEADVARIQQRLAAGR